MSALNSVSVCLAVATHTDRGEVVCVVGDLSELGAWSPHAMIPLVPKAKNDEGSVYFFLITSIAYFHNYIYIYLSMRKKTTY